MELVIEISGLILGLSLWLQALQARSQRGWRLAEARLLSVGFACGLLGLRWDLPQLDLPGTALVLLAAGVAAARFASLARWHRTAG